MSAVGLKSIVEDQLLKEAKAWRTMRRDGNDILLCLIRNEEAEAVFPTPPIESRMANRATPCDNYRYGCCGAGNRRISCG